MTDLTAPEAVADYLFAVDARRLAMPVWPAERRPRDEAAAYAAQTAFARRLIPKRGPVVGWKIGMTSPVIQKQCGFATPLIGPIFAHTIRTSPAAVSLGDFHRLGLELEIAIAMAADVPPAGAPYTGATVAPFVGAVHPAFELIEDRGADYTRLDALHLIADLGWNAGLVLGPARRDWRGFDLAEQAGTTRFNGRPGGAGRSGDCMGHCLNTLAFVANKTIELGQPLRAGQIVSSGSMTACQHVPPLTEALGRVGELGEVRVTVGL